jgi:hypothetical protein
MSRVSDAQDHLQDQRNKNTEMQVEKQRVVEDTKEEEDISVDRVRHNS